MVKFDPPDLYQPRTIEDPLAMIEPVSLEELCKDGKPIYIAALRVDNRTIDLAIDLEPEAQLYHRPLYRLSEYELEILRDISMNASEQD